MPCLCFEIFCLFSLFPFPRHFLHFLCCLLASQAGNTVSFSHENYFFAIKVREYQSMCDNPFISVTLIDVISRILVSSKEVSRAGSRSSHSENEHWTHHIFDTNKMYSWQSFRTESVDLTASHSFIFITKQNSQSGYCPLFVISLLR